MRDSNSASPTFHLNSLFTTTPEAATPWVRGFSFSLSRSTRLSKPPEHLKAFTYTKEHLKTNIIVEIFSLRHLPHSAEYGIVASAEVNTTRLPCTLGNGNRILAVEEVDVAVMFLWLYPALNTVKQYNNEAQYFNKCKFIYYQWNAVKTH